jgi:hypothetical protein
MWTITIEGKTLNPRVRHKHFVLNICNKKNYKQIKSHIRFPFLWTSSAVVESRAVSRPSDTGSSSRIVAMAGRLLRSLFLRTRRRGLRDEEENERSLESRKRPSEEEK